MILTGKCLEDFLKCYNMSNFNELSEILQYALIIEFFDSVGIYIQVRIDFNMQSIFEFNSWVLDSFAGSFNSRQEAAKAAIGKANEIYNNR